MGGFGHCRVFRRNAITLAHVLGMESFKSYVVTNNTHVDRYDPSYPAYPAYTRPIPGPQVGPADRKVGRFRESNGLPCPPERCPWPQSAWFRSIRSSYVAQAWFCNGGRCSLPLRAPNTPKVRFQCNYGLKRTPAKDIAQTVAKPPETCPPIT